MKCEKYEPLLTAYVLGDLDEKARLDLSSHVESCAQCRADMELIRATVGDVKQALQIHVQSQPHLEFKRRLKIIGARKRHRITVTNVLKLAATVVILIGVAGLFMPAMSRSRATACRISKVAQESELSVDLFQESPETDQPQVAKEYFDRETSDAAAPAGNGPMLSVVDGKYSAEEKKSHDNGGVSDSLAYNGRDDAHEQALSLKSFGGSGRLADKRDGDDEEINVKSRPATIAGAIAVEGLESERSMPNGEARWHATPADGSALFKKNDELINGVGYPEEKPAEKILSERVAFDEAVAWGDRDKKEETRQIEQPAPDQIEASPIPKSMSSLRGKTLAGKESTVRKEEDGRSNAGRSGSGSKELAKEDGYASGLSDGWSEDAKGEGAGTTQNAQTEVAMVKSPLVMKSLDASRVAPAKAGGHGKGDASERRRQTADRILGGKDKQVADMKKMALAKLSKPAAAVEPPSAPDSTTIAAGSYDYSRSDVATNCVAFAALQTREEDIIGSLVADKEVERAEKATYPQQVFNPVEDTSKSPFSTFGIDVDTASFTLARRYLLGGQLPPVGAIRVEEFINAFDYAYPSPERRMFAVYTDRARSPFRPNLELLRIGVRGKVLGRDRQRPSALTFVIDTSGSMNTPDRLPLIQKSLLMLMDQLTPRDTVTLIAFGSGAQLVLDSTSASQKDAIRKAINSLQTYGSTQMEGGIRLGYEMAARHFKSGGMNRVLVLSDGVANLGAGTAEEILAQVETYRKKGIYCSVFGFGQGNYNDVMLQTLADKGDGVYRFVDSVTEAKRVFVDDLSATLHVIARDVKIQVEFDPQRVKSYRQLGYEKRHLKKEQFRDDTVDAGEVGSGQSATALYEIEVSGNSVDPLGTVRVRWKDVETSQVEEMSQPIRGADFYPSFEEAPIRYKLAAGLAELAEILRESPYAAGTSVRDVGKILRPIGLELNLDQQVRDLMRMVDVAQKLKK